MALNLEATIGLNTTAFSRGVTTVQSAVAGMVRGFVIGAIGVATVEQALARTIQTADELVNTSKRLDLTITQLQVLRQAAKESGAEFTRLAGALEKLNIARAKALGGNAAAMAAFAALGVSPQMLRTQRAADLATGPISSTLRTGNVESLTPALREVFGKGFGPVVATLRTDFDDLHRSMAAVGALMDEDTAKKLKQFKDSTDLMGSIVTSQLAPVIAAIGDALFSLLELLNYAGAFYGTLISSWLHGQFRGSQTEAAEEGRRVKETWDARRARLAALRATGAPAPPEFEDLETAPKAPRRRAGGASDALVSVGNFLGGDLRSLMGNAQAQIVAATKATAENTRRSNDYLADIRANMASFLGGTPAFALHSETIFPE